MTNEKAIRILMWIFYKVQIIDNENIYNTPPTEEEIKQAGSMAIESLEQDFCSNAVNRQAVIDAIDKWVKDKHILVTLPADEVTPLFKNVYNLPPVTPQPKIGYWIECMPGGTEEWSYRCSECNFWKYKKVINLSKFKFCPNCGCHMKKSEVSDESR